MCLGVIGSITKVWTDGEVPMALVRTGDQQTQVCLLYVPDAGEGDHILVHLGMAVELLDPAEAAATLALHQSATDTDPQQEGST